MATDFDLFCEEIKLENSLWLSEPKLVFRKVTELFQVIPGKTLAALLGKGWNLPRSL